MEVITMAKKIKNAILLFLLVIFKYSLKLIYFFIKLFTIRGKNVFFLSRQFNEIPLNYKSIMKVLDNSNIKYYTICKKIPSSINIIIRNEKKERKVLEQLKIIFSYYFNIYKQMYYCSKSKVIVVDGYNIATSLLKHKKGTKIIQIWHAHAAVKKFGYQTLGMENGLNRKVAKILCMHKNYDYVISGSKEMNKYFSEAFNTPIEKVVDIGTPTIDYMLKTDNRKIQKIFKIYPMLKKKTNILYVPTFRTDGSNDIDDVIDNFNFDKYNLIAMLHPKYKSTIKNDKVITIDRSLFNTYDIMKVSKYVITDYSALILDSAIMNKKILLYVYDYDKYSKENGLNIDLFNELEGNISKDFKDIMNIIETNSYNMNSFNRFKRKYVNNFNYNCTRKLVELIKENL